MSTKTLIGILLAGTTGLLIFLFVHLSSDPSKISIGSKTASACTGSGDECMPVVTFTPSEGRRRRCSLRPARPPMHSTRSSDS